jgi:membrane-bound acyltransferase YfiQ involved in biofilm formation
MFINQNSFAVFALMALVGVSWWAYQGAWAPIRILVLGVLLVVVIATAFWARRTPTAEVPMILQGGQPVLVEYYSDF